MPGHCVKVPQQDNYTDCGLYLLQYVEHFFLKPIVDYHLPIKHLQKWFETIVVTKKREDICNLIKDLIEKHDASVLPLPPIELPTLNGKLICDPSESANEPEFEEDEMEDEFVSAFDMTPDEDDLRLSLAGTGSAAANESKSETNSSSTTTTTTTTTVKPVGSKKTIHFKRIGGQSLINRSSSNNSLLDG
uniref:Ubiquitin-like protease family profile domain-containing protein n=2 Tax=Anopheles stephensi TaxID=30069 RepID=A0A182YT83_ANOST